ncbi:hypothetical protein, partial [Bacillus wiedmannii]|uniref:hypothetical protein n=1 Tax=Bacillus wiedmannii TaxID=1890302 RepID=UPI0019D5D9A3
LDSPPIVNNGTGISLTGNIITLAPSSVYLIKFHVIGFATQVGIGCDVNLQLNGSNFNHTQTTAGMSGPRSGNASGGGIIVTPSGAPSTLTIVNSTFSSITLLGNNNRRSISIRIVQIG